MRDTPPKSIASDIKALIEQFEQENNRLKMENEKLRQEKDTLIAKTSIAKEQVKHIIQRVKALKQSS